VASDLKKKIKNISRTQVSKKIITNPNMQDTQKAKAISD